MTQPAEPPSELRGRVTTATITRREDFADDLWRIWIRPEAPFRFKPGQYCTIGTGGIERPYSIVSSPREKEIELFIEHVPLPDGELTPLLYKLMPGDTVTMRPRAKGLFVLQPGARNHVFISTVTGVVPFVSILRYHLEGPGDLQPQGDFNFYVLEGASYADEFGYDAELARMAAAHQNIKFVPTVSRPTEEKNRSWQGETGRVNTLMEKYLARFGLSPDDTIVYACGHPQMIEDVKRRLDGTGFRVEEERFWKED